MQELVKNGLHLAARVGFHRCKGGRELDAGSKPSLVVVLVDAALAPGIHVGQEPRRLQQPVHGGARSSGGAEEVD